MTDKEQIDEMARTLCGVKETQCENCDSFDCEFWIESSTLFAAGYRKAPDVAREIFEEIKIAAASKIPSNIRPIFKKDLRYGDGVRLGKSQALCEVLGLISGIEKKYTEDK